MTEMQPVSAEDRRRMIAEAAWHRAVARGFTNGDPVSDWLEAEREIDSRLDRGLDRGPDSSPNGGEEHWLAALEGRLATVKSEFEALRKKAGPRARAAREEWKKNVEKLDKRLDKLEDRMEKLRDRGEKATKKAREQAEKVWDEIVELRHRLGRKPL